jgi:hypothetical protein
VFATFSKASEKALGLPSFLQSVMSSVDATEPLAPFAGPGHVNDPDMLLVGVQGMKPYGARAEGGVRGCDGAHTAARARCARVALVRFVRMRVHAALHTRTDTRPPPLPMRPLSLPSPPPKTHFHPPPSLTRHHPGVPSRCTGLHPRRVHLPRAVGRRGRAEPRGAAQPFRAVGDASRPLDFGE